MSTLATVGMARVGRVAQHRAIDDLRNGRYLKIIIGAAVTDAHMIEMETAIYTIAGASAVDVNASTDSIEAAQRGRELGLRYLEERRKKLTPPMLVASVPYRNDVHDKKAQIDPARCRSCGTCLKVCTINLAISPDFRVIDGKCRGCGRCREKCPAGAVKLIASTTEAPMHKVVIGAVNANADAIELHLSSVGVSTFEEVLTQCRESLREVVVSVCLFSNQAVPVVAQREVKIACEVFAGQTLIIQADGIPMSGDNPGFLPGLQAIAAGELALYAIGDAPDVYVQISGGATSTTLPMAKAWGLRFGGVGIGQHSLSVLQPGFDKLHDLHQLEAASVIAKATEFVDTVRSSRAIAPTSRHPTNGPVYLGPGMQCERTA